MATAIDPIRIEQHDSTCVLYPGYGARTGSLGELVIEPVAGAPSSNVDLGVLAGGTPM